MRRQVLRCAVWIAVGFAGIPAVGAPRVVHEAPDAVSSSKRMLDGRQWTTENLNVVVDQSYCYGDREENCHRYGRLYTWESAKRACRALGSGWRLPTNDDWAQMAKPHGGVRDDSTDGGKAAYAALIGGGPSGFEAIYGGGRDTRGQYARLEAHGFYWTASESSSTTAWFYNLGRNGRILNRHRDGQKQGAFTVRCVKEGPPTRTPDAARHTAPPLQPAPLDLREVRM